MRDSSFNCRAHSVHSQRDQQSLLHSIQVGQLTSGLLERNSDAGTIAMFVGTLCNRVSSLETFPAGPTAGGSDSGQLPRPTMVITSPGWNREGENQPGQPSSEVCRLREVSLFPLSRTRKCLVASYRPSNRRAFE